MPKNRPLMIISVKKVLEFEVDFIVALRKIFVLVLNSEFMLQIFQIHSGNWSPFCSVAPALGVVFGRFIQFSAANIIVPRIHVNPSIFCTSLLELSRPRTIDALWNGPGHILLLYPQPATYVIGEVIRIECKIHQLLVYCSRFCPNY